jgi:mRNA-degrading endonuclease RelE of RelBE toxin-antitoxin system
MKVVRLTHFRRMWKKLPHPIQKRASKALGQLLYDRSHPSLRLKRMQRLPGYWEARVDDNHWIICRLEEDIIVLAAIAIEREGNNSVL